MIGTIFENCDNRMAKFYICEHCGNLVTTIHNAGVPLVCCGEKPVAVYAYCNLHGLWMTKLYSNSAF